MAAPGQDFRAQCRQWRLARKLSQLELALEANVSQRHISWLETGRSKPSREMVIRLSEAMDIPLRERNTLLQAAGYASLYSQRSLEEPDMAPVLEALNHVLAHHDPFPAIVVDRLWNIQRTNTAGELLFGLADVSEQFIADMGEQGGRNLAALTFHPGGIRRYISNWEQAAPPFIKRLQREAGASGDPAHRRFCEQMMAWVEPVDEEVLVAEQLLPLLPLELTLEQGSSELKLSLVSVISTFGTPQDITADELRIEAFYPADQATEQFFRSIVAAK